MYLLFYLKGFLPGRVAQSVGHPTRKSGVLGSIPGLATYFCFSFRFFKKAVVSFWRKYVHEVLINRLGGLSLPRKRVDRLTDCPDMTLDVHRGRKTTMQQIEGISKSILLNSILNFAIISISNVRNVIIWHSLVAGAAISSQPAKGLAPCIPQCSPNLSTPMALTTYLHRFASLTIDGPDGLQSHKFRPFYFILLFFL